MAKFGHSKQRNLPSLFQHPLWFWAILRKKRKVLWTASGQSNFTHFLKLLCENCCCWTYLVGCKDFFVVVVKSHCFTLGAILAQLWCFYTRVGINYRLFTWDFWEIFVFWKNFMKILCKSQTFFIWRVKIFNFYTLNIALFYVYL